MTRLLNTFSKFHFSTLELEGNAKEKNETNRQGEKREGKNGDDEFAFAIPDWGTTTSIKEVRGIISGLNVIYNTRYVNLGVLAVDSVSIPSANHLESLNEPIVRWIKTLIRRHTIDHGIRHRLPSRYRPRFERTRRYLWTCTSLSKRLKNSFRAYRLEERYFNRDGILEIHSLDVISYIRGYFFTYICVEFWKEYIISSTMRIDLSWHF